MIGDLHTHTHFSDGSMTREELVKYAKASGLKFLAITDHDTLLTPGDAKALSSKGFEVISGAEMSAVDEVTKRKVHILCLYPDKTEKLEAHCKRIHRIRDKAGMKMLKQVAEIYPIDTKNVIENKGISKSLYKQHIMYELFERGFTTEMYGKLYRHLFGRNGVCYEEVPYPSVSDMLNLIKESGGVAILAHPKVYSSMDLAKRLAKKHLIDGIEVYHYSADEKHENELKKICIENDLIITGGSDFHGIYNSSPRPVGYRYTQMEQLKKIKELKKYGH